MQRAGFPPLRQPECAESQDFKSLSLSSEWHAVMLLLLVFVFQVPTFPVGVTHSFEVLAFTPVPQLIFLKKGTNCYPCWVGGAGVDCLQSSKEGFSQQLRRRTGQAHLGSPGRWGDQGPVIPPSTAGGAIFTACAWQRYGFPCTPAPPCSTPHTPMGSYFQIFW